METVGIREFRDNLAKYTSMMVDAVQVTSHGEAIGYYIPTKHIHNKESESLQCAIRELASLLQKNGISEDDIIADFRAISKNRD
jgi:hypothetical protein